MLRRSMGFFRWKKRCVDRKVDDKIRIDGRTGSHASGLSDEHVIVLRLESISGIGSRRSRSSSSSLWPDQPAASPTPDVLPVDLMCSQINKQAGKKVGGVVGYELWIARPINFFTACSFADVAPFSVLPLWLYPRLGTVILAHSLLHVHINRPSFPLLSIRDLT